MVEKEQEKSLILSLLGLRSIKIIDVNIKNNELIIKVESTTQEVPCHRCGAPTKPHGKGRPLKLRHLPVFGKKTYIEITPPRGICQACDQKGTTTTQVLAWYSKNARYTKAYEEHVLLNLINSTMVDVAMKEEISEHAVYNILNKHIDQNVDWKKIKKIGVLGIDEISIKKGRQDFVTILTSRIDDNVRVLKVIKGRHKIDVVAFFKSIPTKKRKTIVAVCSDMYDGFVNAAKEVFGKKIPVIVDRFHVACLYRKCLTELRKKELKRLKKHLAKEEYSKLKKAIQILQQNKEFNTIAEEEELEKLFHHSSLLRAAYSYCRELTHIFNTHHSSEQARSKFKDWSAKVIESNLTCFNKFMATFEKYETEICCYFDERLNSGFVEGINNKIKVLKRRCYGISNVKNLFKRIYLDLSGYKIFGCEPSMLAYA